MKPEELKPLDLLCDMGLDVNGQRHYQPWKAYDIDEVNLVIKELQEQIKHPTLTSTHKAVRDAMRRHPKFADKFTELSLDDVRKVLGQTRLFNDESPVSYASMLLREEMYEALEQHLLGDYEKCNEELDHCIAVLYRMKAMNLALSTPAPVDVADTQLSIEEEWFK